MKTDDEPTILSAYLDGELAPDQRMRVESALLASADLADELRHLVAVRDLVAGLSRPEIPHDLTRRVVSGISVPRVAAKRRFFARSDFLPALGAAAMILVAVILGFRLAPVLKAPPQPGQKAVVVVRPVQPPRARPQVREEAPPRLRADRASSKIGVLTAVSKTTAPRAPRDEAEIARERDVRQIRHLLDSPKLRCVFLVTDVMESKSFARVDSLIEKTPRIQAPYARLSVSQGIVIDPAHPDRATVFAVVMDDRELKQFEKRLATEFPDAVEQTAVNPAVVTQLADIGEIAVLPGTSAADLLPSPEEPLRVASKARKIEKPMLRPESLDEFDGPIKEVEAPPAVNPDEPVVTDPFRMRSGPHPSTLESREGEASLANREGEPNPPARTGEEAPLLITPRKDSSIVLVWVTTRGPVSSGRP